MVRKSLLFAVLVGLISVHPVFGGSQDENAAVQAAQNFLALVDTGDYGGSWETASRIFQTRYDRAAWVQEMGSVRPFFGRVIGRVILAVRSEDSFPKAPDGAYVVILFQSTFENKEKAKEVVVMTLDGNGQWRVLKYCLM